MLETVRDVLANPVDRMNAALQAGLSESLVEVRKAIDALMSAESALQNAASKVFETPEDDRLMSLCQSVEDIECDVRKQMERMKKLA